MRGGKPGRYRRNLSTFLILLAAVIGCGDSTGSSDPDPLGPQVWTFLLSDAAAGTAWVVQTDEAITVGDRGILPAAARLWTRLDSAPSRDDLVVHATVSGREMTFAVSDGAMLIGNGVARMFAYHGGGGAPRYAGRASVSIDGTMRELRLDAIGGVPMPTEPFADAAPPAAPAAGAVVSLRADDCNAGESDVLVLLKTHRLTAQFAVPSRLVGRQGHCNWLLVDSLAAAGNAIEAHSRFHEASPADFPEFYLETVGAAHDLAVRGHRPRLWIQPGTWLHGPAHLDAATKLGSPYTALLRRVYGAVEAYTSSEPGSALSYACRSTRGPRLYFIKDFDDATLRATLRRAVADGRWIEFMWHTGDQPIARLGEQLAIIAEFRDAEKLRVLPVYDAIIAGATDRP